MDTHPVTNKQFMEFIDDGGYEDYRFWLSDGWDIVNENDGTHRYIGKKSKAPGTRKILEV